jgi:hypothetical protein
MQLAVGIQQMAALSWCPTTGHGSAAPCFSHRILRLEFHFCPVIEEIQQSILTTFGFKAKLR